MPFALSWDGTDQSGHNVPPGVYFMKISDGHSRATVKVAKLR
jgi:flagellar hook assembly protein FlgD